MDSVDDHLATVSVIIPARDAASTIASTLCSLTGISGIAEIILVNDHSSDLTVDVARRTAEENAQPLTVVHTIGSGVGCARNLGLSVSSGELIYFIDGDDLALPDGIAELQRALACDPAAAGAIGSCIDRTPDSEQLHRPPSFTSNPTNNARAYVRFELPLIRVGSALFRRAAIGTVRFREGLRFQEDGLFWSEVLSGGRVITIDRPVMIYASCPARATHRLISGAVANYLSFAREIRKVDEAIIDRRSSRYSRGYTARILMDQLRRRGFSQEANRLLRIVWASDTKFRRSPRIIKARARAWLTSYRDRNWCR